MELLGHSTETKIVAVIVARVLSIPGASDGCPLPHAMPRDLLVRRYLDQREQRSSYLAIALTAAAYGKAITYRLIAREGRITLRVRFNSSSRVTKFS